MTYDILDFTKHNFGFENIQGYILSSFFFVHPLTVVYTKVHKFMLEAEHL